MTNEFRTAACMEGGGRREEIVTPYIHSFLIETRGHGLATTRNIRIGLLHQLSQALSLYLRFANAT